MKTIKDYVVEKQISYTTEEGVAFLRNSDDSYKCILVHFITKDVTKQSVAFCVQDLTKLIEVCSSKWSSAKIIISIGLPRGDSTILNDKDHTCSIKLQCQYIETENVSYCDNSLLGIRGNPNMKLF